MEYTQSASQALAMNIDVQPADTGISTNRFPPLLPYYVLPATKRRSAEDCADDDDDEFDCGDGSAIESPFFSTQEAATAWAVEATARTGVSHVIKKEIGVLYAGPDGVPVYQEYLYL